MIAGIDASERGWGWRDSWIEISESWTKRKGSGWKEKWIEISESGTKRKGNGRGNSERTGNRTKGDRLRDRH